MTAELTWQAEDVVRILHGQCLHEQNWQAHGVAIDSRTATQGDLFVALKGPIHDAHDFAGDAFAKGAAAAIVSRQPPQTPKDAPLIFVEDTFRALEALGQAGRARAQGKIIAVTGSVGKTGTKEMLRLMLNACGGAYANEGSLNNHWGVPLSLARLPAEAHFGVFELGMNHAGELALLSPQVAPHVALITTIEAVHMEFFPSVEAIAAAKAEIFIGMAPDGVAVLNRDNSHFARLAEAARAQGLKKIWDFGRDAKSAGRLLSYISVGDGSEIEAEFLGRRIRYRLGAPGMHLALNSVGALLAAMAAGADMETAAAALVQYQPPQGRGTLSTIPVEGGTVTLIDESYNASPVAVRAALKVLGAMQPPPGGRRIFVLGDMRELGAASNALHADLAPDVIAAGIDLFYGCGEATAHLYEALPPEKRGQQARSSADLAPALAADLRPGDIVAVKGSHSMKMETAVAAIKARGAESRSQKMAS